MASLRRLRELQRQQSGLLHEVYEHSYGLLPPADAPSSGPAQPQPLPRDCALGPIVDWDMALTLRLWHQPSISYVSAVKPRVKQCLVWVAELQDWVDRVAAEPSLDGAIAVLRPSLIEEVHMLHAASFVSFVERLFSHRAFGFLVRRQSRSSRTPLR